MLCNTHGPFVRDFIDNFSLHCAYEAFETKEKTEHLMKHQEEGLKFLLSKKNAFVFQHSMLQRNYLVKNGIKEELIKEIAPPIVLKNNGGGLRKDIEQFVKQNNKELLLFSAVARIDFFKNLELLINSAKNLLERGIPVKILISGGSGSEQRKREELNNLIPIEIRSSFKISERLSQGELYSLFNAVKHKSIFVCTSRYETLGITPLEAALSGICTIIPDSPLVEASRFFPDEYKFKPDVQSLAEIISKFSEYNLHSGDDLYHHMSRCISWNKFKESLIKAWEEISVAYIIR